MSDYTYIAEQAKKTFASVSRLESMLQREPENRAIQTNLISMKRKALADKAEMERIAAINQVEVCQYRMVPIEGASYSLGHVSKSLLEYQNLFSQIYDALKNGIKNKAIIGKEAAQESTLDFAFSYSGSLGVVLLIQSERTFFEGELDRSIEILYNVLDIADADDVRDMSHTLGRAVIKRVHDWSKANVEGGFSADIRWKRSDGKQLGQVIDRSRLEKIVEFIESAPDETTETVEVTGMLVAFNMPRRSFQIVVPDDASYAGNLAEGIDLPEMTAGRYYRAKIMVAETVYYATEQVKRINTLISMSGPLEFNDVNELPISEA